MEENKQIQKQKIDSIPNLRDRQELPAKKKQWTAFALWLIAFYLVSRLLTLGILPLVDPSEGRYALVSLEMAESGDYATPMIWINGKNVPYWGKPPLYFWFGSFFFNFMKPGELAARMPSFLSALILFSLIYFVIKRFRTHEMALLSLVIILTSGGMFFLSGVVLMDMTLTLFTSGALLFYYAFLWEKNRTYKRLLSIGVFVFLAMGFLTKGPVSLIIFGIPVFCWHLLNNRWKILKEHAWLMGGALFLIIVVPWFFIAEDKTPGFLEYFFLNENFYRFFKKGYGDLYGTGHHHWLGTAILYFLVMGAPWSVIAIFYAVIKIVKTSGNLKTRLKKIFITINDHSDKQKTKFDFFLISFSSIVLFWCLAKQIHLYYLILAIPPFGIWLASLINRQKIPAKKILIFSLLTQTVYLISLIFIFNIVNNNKSTREIIDYAIKCKQKNKLKGEIIFVHKTPYSAYFYGHNLILSHPTESVDKTLLRKSESSDIKNLYVVNHKYVTKITPAIKKSFKVLYANEEWTLLE